MDRDPRFDVVYHLYSFELHAYIRVKVGIPAEPCECPSMTDVYVGANWLEREVWDMYGIQFPGHPGLDRILTPEGWEYFALRRDFPLQGPGLIKLYDSVTDVF
jgi:NADH-quinone oxidoreductase subunit C